MRKPVVSTSFNSTDFNGHQYIRSTMPRWDKNNVCHPNRMNKTLQQISDYENNNKYSQNSKIQEKSSRRKDRGHLNRKLFSENVFYDPLIVFSKPIGAIISQIM